MTVAHPPVTRQRHFRVNAWLVAVILLSGALVALGAWVIADQQASTTTSAPIVTTGEVLGFGQAAHLLDGRREAMNAADSKALAAFYTQDAILSDYNAGTSLMGSAAIAQYITGVSKGGFELISGGNPIILEGYVIEPVILKSTTSADRGVGTNVLQLNADGEIAHEWMSSLN